MEVAKQLAGAQSGDLSCDPYDISNVGELWLTGTPFCMLPVVSLDGRPIGTGKPGPVFQQTLAKWNALVGLDIQEQIARWEAS
jgi:branched-chain amino acid aminotransferase